MVARSYRSFQRKLKRRAFLRSGFDGRTSTEAALLSCSLSLLPELCGVRTEKGEKIYAINRGETAALRLLSLPGETALAALPWLGWSFGRRVSGMVILACFSTSALGFVIKSFEFQSSDDRWFTPAERGVGERWTSWCASCGFLSIALIYWLVGQTRQKSTAKILRVIRHPQHFSRSPSRPLCRGNSFHWFLIFLYYSWDLLWKCGAFSRQLPIGRFALGHDGTVCHDGTGARWVISMLF